MGSYLNLLSSRINNLSVIFSVLNGVALIFLIVIILVHMDMYGIQDLKEKLEELQKPIKIWVIQSVIWLVLYITLP